jgi:PAS domain S-box-containing protein
MTNSVPFLTQNQLLDVYSLTKIATAIHVGEDAVIQTANDAMLQIWGKDKSVIGKSLQNALPELKGQPFIEMFRRVWNEGITLSGTDTPADIEINQKVQTFYFDFEYRAVKDHSGLVICILHTAIDVTERVHRQEALLESNSRYLALNEEFSALNEELGATIEELSSSNDELAESESRFRNLISQAPVGICVIRASDLMIQEVNDGYLELVGRTRKELENQTIWDVVSEAAESYAPIMETVIKTGQAFVAKEHSVTLIRRGIPVPIFIDFVYEPVTNSLGIVSSIMVVAIEVTDKVKARRSIEDVEERIRLAVQAAEIGTFDYDYKTNMMVTSDRFNVIFGFENGVSRDEFLNAIHPEDRHLSAEAHERARQTGKMFYEARVVHNDGSIHWMRVQANVYYDALKNPVRLLGTLLDITEFRRLQQQKDDFISIASHELKTPITTLKASLQLLDKMKENPAAGMLPRLIEQSNRSMTKISSLVEDLLNVSRMNEGQIRLTKKKFVISHLLNECCNHVRIAGHHELIFQGDKDLEVYADEHRIDQVVVNFVNNAVKYAPDSKLIYLIAEKIGDVAKISVRDNGPGISPGKLPHLFDRYYRADDSGHQVSGLGLGLYISADIIERHGGEIGVNSHKGHGSTFWFTLPLS